MKGSREMSNFDQRAPRHQSRTILECHSLVTCVWLMKRVFGGLGAIASLDVYQITKYQFLLKNSSFFVVWFLKNSRESFWIRNFMANCLSRRDQKVHLIFQNCAPQGTKVSNSNGFKMKWSVYRDEFITSSNHQFFQDPKSNIWKTFSFFCVDFMIMKFISF